MSNSSSEGPGVMPDFDALRLLSFDIEFYYGLACFKSSSFIVDCFGNGDPSGLYDGESNLSSMNASIASLSDFVVCRI